MVERVVEIVCKAEDVLVGRVTTSKGLNALAIRSGLQTIGTRCPTGKQIKDGLQMQCRHCYEPLFFRASDGECFAANPGTVEINP